MTMVAALYVATGGVYFGLPDVDPWDEQRDARLYAGPHPVVAHPPCARWSRLAGLAFSRTGRKKGDDAGCFAAGLDAVRRWGGVLEHPQASAAWASFGLKAPLRGGGWSAAGDAVGWTCCVEQGHYGHRARKATWLYAANVDLPPLRWGPSKSRAALSGMSLARRAERKTLPVEFLSRAQRIATPPPFRDLLLSIARSARAREAA